MSALTSVGAVRLKPVRVLEPPEAEVPKALEFATKCEDCKQRIPAGVLVEFIRTDGGKFEHRHAGECPPPKPERGQNLGQAQDPEERFDFRDCSICGVEYAIRRGMRYPLPFVCGAQLCSAYAKSKAS